ncbi:CxxxxCH/CxxCH domain c-type cytochrome [Geomesophilobacter sediminis]|uniref:CxxxxCH/CxxCH domain-containing protein n=1 Tax=Geomesophilobacter sediminis TaxID=2798584 RepID=A0A8J7J994_9BACT|nr:CxxxxCH/CxxCH domain-containing protein [Geomesophilobacter sediminis]MBJ6723111.1 CxxxxCH/CxxCH domain-containing protein [Geomesophilobacter sediminis]
MQKHGYRYTGELLLLALTAFGLVMGQPGEVQAYPQYTLDCGSCHKMPPLDSGRATKDKLTGAVPGNHQTHASAAKNSCIECHGSAVTTYTNSHGNKKIELEPGIGYGQPFVNQTSLPMLATCATARCHSDGKGTRLATPAWGGTPFATPADCSQCHGVAPASGNHPSVSGAGKKHGVYYGTGTSSCDKCHPNHLAEGKPFSHATSADHRAVAVGFGAAPNSGGSYNGTSCSVIYCHSNGKGVYAPAAWGGTLPADCSGCHGTAASGTLSGKHGRHATANALVGSGYGCVECHASTVSDNTTVATPANHVNGLINYSGARAGRLAAGSCSSVYCHSDGKGKYRVLAASDWVAGGALSCSSCHGSDPAPAFASVAGEPNYPNAGAGLAGANTHQKHVGGPADCAACHGTTTADGTTILPGAAHANGVIDVVAGSGKSFSYAGKTCSNASCHGGNGIVANVPAATWGATLDCSGCHGTATSNTLSGVHGKHVNNAALIGTNYGCVACHAKTVSSDTTVANRANHLNAMVDYSGVHAGKYSAGNCSTVYCHSDGKGRMKSFAAGAWRTGGALSCNGCHGSDAAPAFTSVAGEPNYANAGASAALANSHKKHVSMAGDCQSCHATTTVDGLTIKPGSAHTDGTIDVVAGNGKSFSYAGKTCSNVSCHSGNGIVGNVAPAAWGATFDCSGCHGTATSNTLSGVHGKHLNNAALLGSNYGCADCHASTVSDNVTIAKPANHGNSLLNYSGAKAGQWNGSSCANVYCHSDGKGAVKTLAANSWTTGGAIGCNGCHGSAAAPAFTAVAGEPNYVNAGAGLAGANTHQKHVASAADCVSCHATTTADGLSLKAGGAHTNGAIDVVAGGGKSFSYAGKTCSAASCHSGNGIVANVVPATWGATLDCSGCHGTATSNTLSGKHGKHVNNAAYLGTNYGCAACHAKTVSSDTTVSNRANHLNALMDYSGAKAGSWSAGNCANVYCHSDGKGTVKALSANAWISGAPLSCNGCHGSDAAPAFAAVAGEPNYVNAGANQAKANSHQKHVAAAADCQSCHATTTVDGISLKPGSTHTDGVIDVVAGNGKSFAYVGKTCSNASCHSGNGIITNVGAATWGATLDCSGCHGTATSNTLSGMHGKHVNNAALGSNYGCVDCHANTVSNNTTIAKPANHANSLVNYSGARAGRLNAGTCSNVYCHSDGKGSAKVLAANAWTAGTPIGCNGCHGSDAAPAFTSVAGEPNYANAGTGLPGANTHQKHVASAADCQSCHATTTVDGVSLKAGAPHANGAIDVVAGNGKSFTYAGKTCSNVSCHSGNGILAATNASTWGGVLGCAGCHGDAATLTTNAHAKHTAAMGYACAVCHSATVSGNSTIVNASLHGDGVIEVAGSFTFSSADKSCATSCHGTGTPKWNVAASGACGSCHAALSTTGGIIATGGHAGHYSAYGPGLDGASGNSCAACHSYTGETASTHADGSVELASGFNKSGTCGSCHRQSTNWTGGRVSCESCHTTVGGDKATLSVIAGVTAPDVSQAAVSGHGKAGIALGCASCHNDSGAHIDGIAGSNKRLLNALTGSVNTECRYCHDDATKVATASFRNMSTHVTVKGGNQDMACAQCHDPHGSTNLAQIKTLINGKTITFTDASAGYVDTTTNQGLCQVCHTQTNHFKAGVAEGNHPTKDCLTCHKHNAAGGAFKLTSSCDACHGYPPAPRNVAGLSFGTMGNWSSARFEEYSGGGGAHLIAAHVSPNAKPSEGWVNCAGCHNGGKTANAPYHLMATPIASHVENVHMEIDPQLRFSNDSFPIYTGARLSSGNNQTGSCFNVSCHFKLSPRWSTEK